ncbi:MAG: hypothetical protein Q7K40_00250 [bacterium]|nr:hypothetical protein [bacterium]
MLKTKKNMKEAPVLIPVSEFLESYNKNMPATWPRVTAALLQKFRDAHTSLFTQGDMWSLDQHRKKLMDWLPRNSDSDK